MRMLELIAKYAIREGLTVRPGFTAKTVKWLIEIDALGNYVGIQELGNAGDNRNLGLEFNSCPEFPQNEMQSGGKAHPVVESLSVVALLAKTEEMRATPKDFTKHAYFSDLLRDLGTKMPEAAICVAALSNSETLLRIQSDFYRARAKPTDKASFAVNGRALLDSKIIAEWWVSRRGASQATIIQPGGARCLVTGELTTPLATHPKIGGLSTVGGLPIGSSLISFDKGAFTSFGLDQSANAVVSEEAAMQYRAGLNHLISRGKKLGPMIVGHWFSGGVPEECDLLPWLIDGEEHLRDNSAARSRMQQLLAAVEAGERGGLGAFRYYVLTVSGAAGRVMLRDWQEGQYADLVSAVSKWFRDLSIVATDGQREIHDPKFIAVAGSTVRELDNLEAPMMAALWRAAFTSGKVPLAAVRGAVSRNRIDVLEDVRRPIRMALLKAYVIRNTNHGEHMQPYLNTEHPKAAYQAGRLMAVLANIQYEALGDVNANIVQRFYPAASSTPALVFGRLTRQSQFHLNKIDGGLAHFLEEKLAAIWGQIQSDLPTTFSLEEQTLFALGYYQQLARDSQDRISRAAAKKAKAEQGSQL